jgi:hypothetical protein
MDASSSELPADVMPKIAIGEREARARAQGEPSSDSEAGDWKVHPLRGATRTDWRRLTHPKIHWRAMVTTAKRAERALRVAEAPMAPAGREAPALTGALRVGAAAAQTRAAAEVWAAPSAAATAWLASKRSVARPTRVLAAAAAQPRLAPKAQPGGRKSCRPAPSVLPPSSPGAAEAFRLSMRRSCWGRPNPRRTFPSATHQKREGRRHLCPRAWQLLLEKSKTGEATHTRNRPRSIFHYDNDLPRGS